MQLHDHALGHLPHALVGLQLGASKKCFAAGAVEARIYVGDEVHGLAHPDPARQYGHVGDEGDLTHQLVALLARVEAEHVELAAEIGEAKDRLERSRLARAVRADQAHDAAGLDLEADLVQRQRRFVVLAEAVGRDHRAHACSPLWLSASRISVLRSSPSRCRRAYTTGHSSRRKRSRSDFNSASCAPSMTNMPRPLLFSTSCSSTSS